MLRQIDLIAAQNDESAERFRALGRAAERVHVTGSLKYDGAQTDRDNPRTAALRELAGIADDDIVFLAGSTQEPEEQIAVDIFRRLAPQHPRLRLILVPRHPERFDAVAKLLDDVRPRLAAPLATERSRNPQLAAVEPRAARRPILLVDTVGELGAWWGTATIAFVGGSFGSRGGQNMIEPAAYGAAVSFGPNTWNFRDIVAALLAADAAVVVRDAARTRSVRPPLPRRSGVRGRARRRAQALVQLTARRDARGRSSCLRSLRAAAGQRVDANRSRRRNASPRSRRMLDRWLASPLRRHVLVILQVLRAVAAVAVALRAVAKLRLAATSSLVSPHTRQRVHRSALRLALQTSRLKLHPPMAVLHVAPDVAAKEQQDS